MDKDELLKRIQEGQKREEKRKKELEQLEKPPKRMSSRMPLGCWIWIILAAIAAYALLKKYGI